MAGKTVIGVIVIAGGIGLGYVAFKPTLQGGLGAVSGFVWNEFYHHALPAAGFPISAADVPTEAQPGHGDTSPGMCANAQQDYDSCLAAGGSKGSCFTQVSRSYPGCGVKT